jgi:alpha-tubulin suppressor-like RCC1 family protein
VRLEFTTTSAEGSPGWPLATIGVRILDSAGVVVDSSVRAITVSLTDSATLTGSVTRNATAGIARFDHLAIDRYGTHPMVASANGLAPDTLPIQLSVGTQVHLRFRTHIEYATPGVTLRPAPELVAEDAAGNIVTSYSDSVTIRVASGQRTPLLGTTTRAMVHGVAVFDDIRIDSIGYYLLVGTQIPGTEEPSLSFASIRPRVDAPSAVQGGVPFTRLASGAGSHQCALASDGAAWCWGANRQGQLGNGTLSSSATPVPVSGGLHFIALSHSWSLTCGLTDAHATWCWGGIPNYGSEPAPRLVDTALVFRDIAVGYSSVCGLTAAGRILCGKVNPDPSQGAAWTVSFSSPFADDVPAFASLASADSRACGVTIGGAVYCQGGFFTGDSYQWSPPEPESQGRAFIAATGSSYHMCALEAGHAAYCWGENDGWIANQQTAGELGIGTRYASVTPAAVAGGHRFSSISAGFGHTCAIADDGSGWCWGTNPHGELGTSALPDGMTEGDRQYMLSPAPVTGALRFTAVQSGFGHTCALTADGRAWCWGDLTWGRTLSDQPTARYLTRMDGQVRAMIAAARAARTR